jgi:hypothetical protein
MSRGKVGRSRKCEKFFLKEDGGREASGKNVLLFLSDARRSLGNIVFPGRAWEQV